MRCEESAIFFENLAFISHIRQHHSTSLLIFVGKILPTNINSALNKLIPTEVTDIILVSSNASKTS